MPRRSAHGNAPQSRVIQCHQRNRHDCRKRPAPERKLVLRALEELSVEETAAALGITAATVRTRFFRARGRLREALSQEIDLAFDDAFAFAGARCDRMVANVLRRLQTRLP